ncbi:ATP-grasp domain-containing protein [Kitasatospora sp. NBC_01266]|uniref:ATP-grasp domain-containing protein n=1 Tax=Kitasatospora sp. NBC_01266 TaxID=2903572 RepID=UPI002E3429E2|nr:hypothetical protein [Kitasatospora sp. NBC_01266]
MTDRGASRFLLLNSKEIVHRLPQWFPDARDELVVVTTREALDASPLPDPASHFRHLQVMEDFDDPRTEHELADLCRRFGVERVLSTGERGVLRAARLRHRFGLPGQDLATATAFRDKFVMKSRLAEAGIEVAPMRLVDSAAELRDFAAEVGFPVVVKPLDRGGSAGLRVLDGPVELAEFLRDWDPGRPRAPRLAEAWIDGDFYQVNGLMAEGRIVFGQPCLNPYSDWFSVQFDAPGMSAMLPGGHPLTDRLHANAARVLAALPPVPGVCAFQTEFFHTPDDRLVLCEAACRAGGSAMVDTHEAVYGVNLHGASLLGQAGRGTARTDYPPLGPLQGYARFPPARGVLRAIPGECPLPGALSYTASGEVGRRYQGARSLGPSIALLTFTLSGPDVRAELREVEEWWERNTHWEDRTNALSRARQLNS